MSKKIFVSGATGFQGSKIAQLFIVQGDEVISLVPSSDAEQLSKGNLKLFKGGFQDKAVLDQALDSVDVAVFTFPLIFDIEIAKSYTSNFIASAEAKNVPLVIFNTSFDLPKQKTGLLALDLKIEINALFEKSNLNVVTLVPDIYIDNLAAPWSIPVILQNGILPYPIESDVKIPWISHIDLAKTIVSAANHPELAGRVLPIGGNRYSGEEIAQTISNHINKPLKFISLTPDDFEQQLISSFGELAAKEISNLYRYVKENKNELVNKDFDNTQRLLAIQPQSIDDWVKTIQWGISL